MKSTLLFVVVLLCSTITSCTLDKTDFESELERDVTEFFEFKEAVSFTNGNFNITIDALNGTFYKGYNEIRVKVSDAANQPMNEATVTFLPIFTNSNNDKFSCPHRYQLVFNQNEKYYSGYVVFGEITNAMEFWELFVGVSVNGETQTTNYPVMVQSQTNQNLNMTNFIGNDGEKYTIALVAPQKPKVAENELVAGIYRYIHPTESAGTFPDPSQFSFSEVQNYTLLLDPRMPEPSMGNHSSPNNVDLTQNPDGLYYGVVNYTMTGKWTLNFILKNGSGEIIKGTEVPTDFTPGIEGVKSELHLNILF